MVVLLGYSFYQTKHTRSSVTAFLQVKQQYYVSRRREHFSSSSSSSSWKIENNIDLILRKSYHLSSCSRKEDGTTSFTHDDQGHDDDNNVEEEENLKKGLNGIIINYPWRYRILKYYNNPISTQQGQLQYDDGKNHSSSQPTTLFLPEGLFRMDPNEFPTVSQAKKACRLGRVLVLRKVNPSSSSSASYNENLTYIIPSNDTEFMPYQHVEFHEESLRVVNPILLENWENVIGEIFGVNDSDKSFVFPFLGQITFRLDYGDVIAIQTRVSDEFYPSSVTNYILPPDGICNLFDNDSNGQVIVVYEDDFLAIVNKPENLTTIGGADGSRRDDGDDGARNDLQSMLGFILHPPPPRLSMKQVAQRASDPYLPRPVHRLDRKTSGLVLVAKSQDVMRRLSSYFESRTVRKSYTALVFHGTATSEDLTIAKKDETALIEDTIVSAHEGGWNCIDYPIDGKSAQSNWRLLRTFNISLEQVTVGKDPLGNGICAESSQLVSIIEVRPHTGRNHQVRRHLAYCLGWPIVGDTKYDKGHSVAKKLRVNGMYLCCHSLDLPYPYGNPCSSQFDRKKDWKSSVVGFANPGETNMLVRYEDANRVSTYCHNVDGKRRPRLRVTIQLPAKFRLTNLQRLGLRASRNC